MEQSKTTDASGGGDLSVLRHAARAGRLRVRRNERLPSADPDVGMVWPIEVELPCINGLSCWFSLGSVYAPDAAAQGYTDGALNDDLAQAFAQHIVAAIASAPLAPTPEAGSDLARLSARARNVVKRCLQRADMDEEISKDTLTEAATVLEKMAAHLASASPPPGEDLAGQGEIKTAWIRAERDRAVTQRDSALDALHKVGVAVGVLNKAVACNGPQLIAAMEAYCDHLASEPSPDLAGQGEPVAWAWQYQDESGEWADTVSDFRPSDEDWRRNIEPLFKRAAPAPSRPADREEIARVIRAMVRVNWSQYATTLEGVDEAADAIFALRAPAHLDREAKEGVRP